MKLKPSHRALSVTVLVLLATATACGSDDATKSTTAPTAAPTTPVATTPATSPATTPGTDAAGAATLATADSPLGTILVDGAGHTLYAFEPDAQGASVCTGDCLAAWPSFSGPASPGEGVDASMIGTSTRTDDGSVQVTYNGWPLYYFANDKAPGDTNGQGVGDKWYVVTPAGTFVE